MVPILLGALIEAIGFIVLMIGSMKQGMPPGPIWLIPAIVLIVFGNGLVVYTVFSRARAGRKK
ncbi:hypothetical protein BH10PLA1_BH10PLA1_07830 [soil metagenome]